MTEVEIIMTTMKTLFAYDKISEYQQCQMEYIHDASHDRCIFENTVPIIDRHLSSSEHEACGNSSKRYAAVDLTFHICMNINRCLVSPSTAQRSQTVFGSGLETHLFFSRTHVISLLSTYSLAAAFSVVDAKSK